MLTILQVEGAPYSRSHLEATVDCGGAGSRTLWFRKWLPYWTDDSGPHSGVIVRAILIESPDGVVRTCAEGLQLAYDYLYGARVLETADWLDMLNALCPLPRSTCT